MKRIVFATSNEGKLKEIKMIMAGLPYEVVSMKEAGITVDIEESGITYEQNAMIKARLVSKMTSDIVMADDSGFEVEYMNNEPGVYSSRFLGEDTPYSYKNGYILDKLQGAPDYERGARFVCVVACIFPDGRSFTTRGEMKGRVADKPAGSNGFGYDPILYLPEYGCTSAELDPEEKNKISHRGKALREMKLLLEKQSI